MSLSSRKILVVDDSPIVRAVVAHTLSSVGFSVAAIEDPSLLDDAVMRESPDLLLVDATFPGVTDDGLVDAIAKHVGHLPVLLFSDRARAELDVLVQRSGARGVVPKDSATLAGRVSSVLDG